MAKTRHYRKRTTRKHNKRTRKHKGGVGSSPEQTIVNVPASAKRNIVLEMDGNTYAIPIKKLKEMLMEDERSGNGPEYSVYGKKPSMPSASNGPKEPTKKKESSSKEYQVYGVNDNR